MPTGVRAIDGFLTVGDGQRIGIFAGSGVGKSTTLGMIAREAKADINVISLIGERGREVLEFIEKDLGPEGMKRSIVVCATSDKPALIRIKGALTATAIAEYFRDKGKKVILMMDSDFHSKEDEEYKLFVDKMNKLIDKLKPYFKVELCYNNIDIDAYKFSPTDYSLEDFKKIYKRRIKCN